MTELPPLPEGFTLDVPPPPEGFTIDEPDEVEARSLPPLPSGVIGPDDLSAAATLGSGIVGTIGGGIAGLFGTGFGLVPGGESPNEKGNRFLNATRNFLTIPSTAGGADRLEAVGKISKGISSVGALPFGHLPDDPESFRANVTDRQQEQDLQQQGVNRLLGAAEEGPSRAFGGAVLEATGSPAAATAAETLPAAVASTVGLRSPVARAVPDVPKPKPAPILADNAQTLQATIGQPKPITPVDFTPAETIIQSLRKGKSKAVADAVVPDKAVIESAQRLHVDLNPEHYSTNAAFQDVARALKTQPGSALQAKEVAALTELSKRADDLVLKNKGTLDKGEFSQTIGEEIGTTIDDLGKQANVAYESVRQAVPIRTKVNTQLIRDYLDEKIADFGGDVSQLSKVEKEMLGMINRKVDGKIVPPTYATLDNVRRNVGAGFSRQGPFKDGVQGNLEQVYGVLSDVQGGVARSFGAGNLYDGARALVVQRKALEDSAVQMFGRNLSNSLVPKIKAAGTGLVKGDVSKFNQLIHSLPKHRRAEAAATILGDIFAGGSRRGGELSTGFAASWKALNRNKTAKDALFAHLSPAARKSFDDIGRVMTGIVESNRKSLGNPSGTAGGIIKALDDLSIVEKVYDVGKKAAAAEGVSSAIGLPGAGTAGVVGTMLAKQRTPIVVAADRMLASPQFSQAINKAIKGDVAAANKVIQGSSAYNKWLATIDDQARANIARVGFIAWITSKENQ